MKSRQATPSSVLVCLCIMYLVMIRERTSSFCPTSPPFLLFLSHYVFSCSPFLFLFLSCLLFFLLLLRRYCNSEQQPVVTPQTSASKRLISGLLPSLFESRCPWFSRAGKRHRRTASLSLVLSAHKERTERGNQASASSHGSLYGT